MKRVVFIHPAPWKHTPRALRLRNITKELGRFNSDFTIEVCALHKNDDFSLGLNIRKNFFSPLIFFMEAVKLPKLASYIFNKVKTLDGYLIFSCFIRLDLFYKYSLLRHDNNLIFVVMVSPFSSYVMVPWLKKSFPRAKVICDIGDPLYNNAARWNNDFFSRSIEKNAISFCDHLIFTNEETRLAFINEYFVSEYKTVVIPQGIDISALVPKSKEIILRGSMVYAGRFYDGFRSPVFLFDALKKNNFFTLDVFGSCKFGLVKNVNFHNPIDQGLLFAQMKDYQVLLYIDNDFGIQSSGKIFELLAFKKPILFISNNKAGPNYKLALKYSNVFFCDNTTEDISRALDKLSSLDFFEYDYDISHFSWAERALVYKNILVSGHC